jgi:hypothetical protein
MALTHLRVLHFTREKRRMLAHCKECNLISARLSMILHLHCVGAEVCEWLA